MSAVVVPAARGGRHYSISRNRNGILLTRVSKLTKKCNTIPFAPEDVIAVTNALVDALESDAAT